MDMKLEVVVIPVADVDRSKDFYGRLGWRLDADKARGTEFRVVQFTPPGSPCSIHFGKGVTDAAPGSAQNLYLIVADIEAAREDLARHGADIGVAYHRTSGGTAPGRDPEHQTYNSFARFKDPDGNSWLLQEITGRLPGRMQGDTIFRSVSDLTDALRRAAAAHGEHERRTGERDENWADWYAQYLVNEQAGQSTPT